MAFALSIGAPSLTTDGVTGHAARASLPLPPPVGSCITLPADQAASEWGQLDFAIVPCDRGHDAEITMTWSAGSEPQSAGRDRAGGSAFRLDSGRVSSPYFICSDWSLAYVGTPMPLGIGPWWPARLDYRSGFVTAPPGQRAGGLGWSGCFVEPPANSARYVGSISAAGAQLHQSRPGQFATCLADSDQTEMHVTTCDLPHRIEPLAVDYGLDPAENADPGNSAEHARERCADAVRKLTAARDPSFGGRLAVEVDSEHLQPMTLEQAAALPDNARPTQECRVALVGPGVLVGSVVGLGDSPLPIA